MTNDVLTGSNEIPGLDHPLVCNVCYTEMKISGKREWICPKCGTHAYQRYKNDPESIYYEHDDEEDYSESYDNDMPEGCRACGSDQYPICMEGCALMDI